MMSKELEAFKLIEGVILHNNYPDEVAAIETLRKFVSISEPKDTKEQVRIHVQETCKENAEKLTRSKNTPALRWGLMECPACNGKGSIDLENMTIGEYQEFKQEAGFKVMLLAEKTLAATVDSQALTPAPDVEALKEEVNKHLDNIGISRGSVCPEYLIDHLQAQGYLNQKPKEA